jgi:hypothetical protein
MDKISTVSKSRAGGCFGVTSSPLLPPTSTSPFFDEVTALEFSRQNIDLEFRAEFLRLETGGGCFGAAMSLSPTR